MPSGGDFRPEVCRREAAVYQDGWNLISYAATRGRCNDCHTPQGGVDRVSQEADSWNVRMRVHGATEGH